MRMPLMFQGPGGSWDLMIFESIAEAICEAEPPDVVEGEYGDHGWDADAKPVALVVVPTKTRPGLLGKLLGLFGPPHEVEVQQLDAPAEPELLREVLIGHLAWLRPDHVAAAERLDLDDLISLLVRGSIRAGGYRR